MDDSLVARRSKRSTAGNRMEAALAEFKAEDVGMDVDEDADFALGKEEEDIFESDFESTDEEGEQEDVDAAAEKLIHQEESRVRKTGRTQLERITALAHARQAATFNPTAIAPSLDKPKGEKKLKRRVSLGIAVNAETGEVLEGGIETEEVSASVTPVGAGKRHSTRTHTVANTSATFSRARDELRKQASIPKRTKTQLKAPTQEELMMRALSMEEGNIDEHKNYLTLEEEKRRKARVVRASVQGPLLRWVSKKEEETVLVQPPPPPPLPPAPSNPYVPYHHVPSPSVTTPTTPTQYSYTYGRPSNAALALHPSQYASMAPQPSPFQQWPPTPTPPAHHQSTAAATPPAGVLASSSTPYTPVTSYSPVPSSTPAYPATSTSTSPTYTPPTYSSEPAQLPVSMPNPSPSLPPVSVTGPTPVSAPIPVVPPTPAMAPPSQLVERKDTVAKQYVVHETTQSEKNSRPPWHTTMTAMFGDHADWENCRVYTAKGRPLARPTQICPITGKAAKYLDPRTNVPYADLDAYRVLSMVLRHEHVWSPTLGCYVSREGSVFSQSAA
ncbi:YL1 nuclear protein-domain-containing protein [Ganoderma leucocontextum]|nr:YL1 nuclear protein-domain-containing protein [Ganoderma leucocontextum]